MDPARLGFRPPSYGGTPGPDVERRENKSGVGTGDLGERLRLPDRERADDDRCGAGDQPSSGQGPVADPTRDLDGDTGGGDHVGDRLSVVTIAAGRVEVDDVDAMGAGAGEGAGQANRIVRVSRLTREVTLFEPDRAPAAQVDRRDDVQR